jgi:hypothetical protein
MTRPFAVGFVMIASLANRAAAQRPGRGSGMGFALNPERSDLLPTIWQAPE